MESPPSLLIGLEPPPGLEQKPKITRKECDQQDERIASVTETQPGMQEDRRASANKQDYQVLLQNVPMAMLSDCMLMAMLDQANLQDARNVTIRSSGKVLIGFASYASVCKCIKHFRGRQWGEHAPVEALLVRTAKPTDKPQLHSLTKHLSINAPMFVPRSKLSASAPIFTPSSIKFGTRDRIYSCETDAGPTSDEASDGCD
jgi:hypothetical protein